MMFIMINHFLLKQNANSYLGKSKKGGKKGEIEEAKADEKKPQRAISAYIYYSND